MASPVQREGAGERLPVPIRLGGAVEPHRLLARLREPVRHLQQRVRRVGVVAAAAAAREGHALSRPPGAAVLPALRHGAVEPRAGARLRGDPGQVDLRDVPARRRERPRAGGVDHDAVDAAEQRGGRGASRSRVRRVRRGRTAAHPGQEQGPRAVRRRQGVGRRQWGGAGGPVLPASSGRGADAGRPETRDRGARRVRHGGRWIGPGAHGAGIRRRRLRRGAGAWPGAGTAGGGRRHLPRHDLARDRGQARHGGRDEQPHHPSTQGNRAAAGRPRLLRPHLSPLLALQQQADLLRARLVVRAHVGGEAADAGAQRAGELAPARDGDGPVRRVAREQRGLGALARPLLGHAAPGVGVGSRPVARRGDRELRRAREEGGPRAAGRLRPAQAVHRRVHLAGTGRRHDAPRRPR